MIEKPDRREFLKSGLVATAAAVAAGTVGGIFSPGKSFGAEMPDLVVSHGLDPAAITRAAVDALGGIKRFVKPGNKVVIKPNMSFASGPQTASNTHPAVVGEVARMCAEAGASRISILDNPLQQPQDCLAMSKIPEMCEVVPNTRVYVIKPQRLFREVKLDRGILVKSMEVSSEVLDSDVLISVPVGKTHGSAGVSLSMKGMMGLIFDTDRRAFHSHGLHESIVDMVTILKPHLVVIDGTRILASGGPGGPGEVIPLNVVIASPDMVAADAQMVALGTWYGKKIEPAQVRYISMAAQRGLGRIDLDKLNIKNVTV